MTKVLIYILFFGSVTILGSQLVPVVWDKFYSWRVHGVELQRARLKEVFLDMDPQKLFVLNVVSPTVLCLLGLLFFRSLIGSLIGLGVGFAIPALIVKNLIMARK